MRDAPLMLNATLIEQMRDGCDNYQADQCTKYEDEEQL